MSALDLAIQAAEEIAPPARENEHAIALAIAECAIVQSHMAILVGNHLAGGPQDTSALPSLASDHFDNWSAGLNLTVPIGFRSEHAAVRGARPRAGRGPGAHAPLPRPVTSSPRRTRYVRKKSSPSAVARSLASPFSPRTWALRMPRILSMTSRRSDERPE